jgi:hypothetical protein
MCLPLPFIFGGYILDIVSKKPVLKKGDVKTTQNGCLIFILGCILWIGISNIMNWGSSFFEKVWGLYFSPIGGIILSLPLLSFIFILLLYLKKPKS